MVKRESIKKGLKLKIIADYSKDSHNIAISSIVEVIINRGFDSYENYYEGNLRIYVIDKNGKRKWVRLDDVRLIQNKVKKI